MPPGARHAPAPAAPPSPSRTAAPASAAPAAPFSAGGFPLSQSGPQCSVQACCELQVGLQITNLSPAVIQLRRVEVGLPLGRPHGDLADLGTLRGTARLRGARRHPAPGPGTGASTWITVTFQVLVRCPQPLPVQFTFGDHQNGRVAAIRLPGFPDLSQVPYSGCR